MYDIEELKKNAWRYDCVQRDTKTNPCEYGLLTFRLDTMEEVLFKIHKKGLTMDDMNHLFQLTEHTIYGVHLKKSNRYAYPFEERIMIEKHLRNFQNQIIHHKWKSAFDSIKEIRNYYSSLCHQEE
jgi:hypothetical protein